MASTGPKGAGAQLWPFFRNAGGVPGITTTGTEDAHWFFREEIQHPSGPFEAIAAHINNAYGDEESAEERISDFLFDCDDKIKREWYQYEPNTVALLARAIPDAPYDYLLRFTGRVFCRIDGKIYVMQDCTVAEVLKRVFATGVSRNRMGMRNIVGATSIAYPKHWLLAGLRLNEADQICAAAPRPALGAPGGAHFQEEGGMWRTLSKWCGNSYRQFYEHAPNLQTQLDYALRMGQMFRGAASEAPADYADVFHVMRDVGRACTLEGLQPFTSARSHRLPPAGAANHGVRLKVKHGWNELHAFACLQYGGYDGAVTRKLVRLRIHKSVAVAVTTDNENAVFCIFVGTKFTKMADAAFGGACERCGATSFDWLNQTDRSKSAAAVAVGHRFRDALAICKACLYAHGCDSYFVEQVSPEAIPGVEAVSAAGGAAALGGGASDTGRVSATGKGATTARPVPGSSHRRPATGKGATAARPVPGGSHRRPATDEEGDQWTKRLRTFVAPPPGKGTPGASFSHICV